MTEKKWCKWYKHMAQSERDMVQNQYATCSTGVCFNGGTCTGGYSQSCQCATGFQGPRCQYDTNECLFNNGGCQGSCCNTIGSFYCKCTAGQELSSDGKSCIDIDECKINNGGCSDTCTNTFGGYQCECPDGQKLHADGRTCVPEDGCLIDNGGCEHQCISHEFGAYRCQCFSGYRLALGGKRCEIANPCRINNGGCAHTCLNFEGLAHCSCNTGYELNEDLHSCTDIDECASKIDECAQTCINTEGSYRCACKPNFELEDNGFKCYRIVVDVVTPCNLEGGCDPCLQNNGGCEHECRAVGDTIQCACYKGYVLAGNSGACEGSITCFCCVLFLLMLLNCHFPYLSNTFLS
ncbi:multiple epidermal growth factor-like domains protein 6 [Anneissia japonica]|uniref:multiple epidermal growth factor-like domains protein 6 n=1 Tax=Anneissia japonica TaxID=1529436 RepID=UPI0014257149|nr:multiple epidermal growth factor-like domains protein 6 [Anneissia japonica]